MLNPSTLVAGGKLIHYEAPLPYFSANMISPLFMGDNITDA